jgi:hypothetical protein
VAKSFTQEGYWRALEQCGWLAALPAQARRKLQRGLAKEFGGVSKRSSIDLFHLLAVTILDMEMIEGCGPKEECSYYSAIRELAQSSFGHFAPTSIRDKLDAKTEKAHISFLLGGKPFKITVPWETDWFQPQVIEKLINGALQASGVAHRFHVLPAVDQCAALAFVPDAVWRKATASGVFPKQEEVLDLDL